MGYDLPLEKRPDARRDALGVGRVGAVDERDAFGVAELGVGLRISVFVAADSGGFVPLR